MRGDEIARANCRVEKLEPNGALAVAVYAHVAIKVHAPKNTPLDCTKRRSEFGNVEVE